MQIGRRIFYNLNDGKLIYDSGEREGDVVETTIEQDVTIFGIPSNYGVVHLPFGALKEQFSSCYTYSIDTKTKEIIFDYNFPPAPPQEPTELEKLQEYALELEYQLALYELGLGGAN